MAKPDKPSDPPAAPAVTAIDDVGLFDKDLQFTVGMLNAIVANDLLDILPPGLGATFRAELVAAVAADQARGTARGEFHGSIEERRAVEEEAAPVLARVASLIEGGLPIGTPGRVDYFPVEDSNPTDGDLLVSFGKGTARKGWPKLPNGWTAEYLQALGTRLNKAQKQSTTSTKGRSGHTKVSKTIRRGVAKIRTRLRQLLIGWFGAASVELLKFGLQPRKPGPGRGRAKGKGAKAAKVGEAEPAAVE